jgi:hypothetical protein
VDDFIKCTNCNQSVPAGFGVCQFCQASLSGVAKPNPQRQNYFAYEDDHNVGYFGKPTWVKPAYYAVSTYFVVSALVGILLVLTRMKGPIEGIEIIAIAAHSIGLIIGIGLLAKIEMIRGIVNFVCSFRILLGLLAIPSLLMEGMFTGFAGVIATILAVLDLITNGMMIYLIGETD